MEAELQTPQTPVQTLPLPFSMAELTDEARGLPFPPRELMEAARDQMRRFSELQELVNQLHRDSVPTFSKAHHNLAFTPRSSATPPAPVGKPRVKAHLRGLPAKQIRRRRD